MTDPFVSQTDSRRIPIPGRLHLAGPCTVLLHFVSDQWHLYRLGIVADPVVLIADGDLRDAARQILGGRP